MIDMLKDNMVRDALHNAWEQVIDKFKKGCINSERALQAALICKLQSELPDLDVLCEPTIMFSSGTKKPDILVTNARDSVVAAIEIKYVPEGLPRFEDDIKKLKEYQSSIDAFPLTVDPASGRFDERMYRFSSDCLFVFAVIGHYDSRAIEESTLSQEAGLGEKFLPLTYAVGG